MAEALGDRLVTATVGFGERKHNELDAAALVATHFRSRHYADVIEPHLEDVIGPVTDRLGEPLADPTRGLEGAPSRLISKMMVTLLPLERRGSASWVYQLSATFLLTPLT